MHRNDLHFSKNGRANGVGMFQHGVKTCAVPASELKFGGRGFTVAVFLSHQERDKQEFNEKALHFQKALGAGGFARALHDTIFYPAR